MSTSSGGWLCCVLQCCAGWQNGIKGGGWRSGGTVRSGDASRPAETRFRVARDTARGQACWLGPSMRVGGRGTCEPWRAAERGRRLEARRGGERGPAAPETATRGAVRSWPRGVALLITSPASSLSLSCTHSRPTLAQCHDPKDFCPSYPSSLLFTTPLTTPPRPSQPLR